MTYLKEEVPMFYEMFRSVINFSFLLMFAISTVGLFSSVATAEERVSQSQQQIATLTVNINKASAEELSDVMTGVGLKKATTIVEYREKTGSFKSIDDLLQVKGIGPATLEKNRHKLKI